ncbi:GOR [Symbiodinium pilosum]|uniref:GOR protein n=1 Tax=Symbiodinium pilosum TaxID=2952 RepID=A0A812NYL9_SYMPI|nr:GOR [Symbiodinium pilosum]
MLTLSLRTALDPHFRQRASKQDVLQAASAVNLEGGEVAAHVLLTQFGSCETLSLVELSPEAGVLVCRFRRFLNQFGTMRKFLEELQLVGSNMEMSFKNFTAFCRRHGFDPDMEEVREIFSLCSNGKDHLLPEDFLFLELDEDVRQQEFVRQTQLKFAKEDVHQAFLAETYNADRGRGVSNRHRLAPRPWHDRAFETLPQVISRRNQSWFHERRSKNAEARQHFLTYIRTNYGSEVRAWRKALDPDATFQLTLSTFKRWFRNETNLRECIDLQTLWRALDRDGSGCLGMEELAPQAAATLSYFRKWLRGRLGTCASAWEHEAVEEAFSSLHADGWVSRTKLLVNAFAKAVKQLGWRPILNHDTRAALLASLDYFGCGFLSRSDLEWLDAWEPPEWLYSQPDAEAWVQLRRLINGRFEHPLAAWRGLLDRDDSNSVSWNEFKEACRKVGFQGNMGGAWRALDHDLSGTITLREFDAASAKILTSFKAWCDSHYGSFEHLFKSMDKDRSGGVSFSELRRACKNGGWKGNVHILFKCLDVDSGDGQKTIELEELQFLDSWDPLEDEPLEAQEQSQVLMERKLPARRSQLSRSSPVLPKLV